MISSGFWGGGGYDGARTDIANLRNWTPSIGSPDSDVVPSLEMLRARSRDLARNAPLIAGALDTHLTAIIGPGLVPHPRIDRKLLGLTEEQANAWQDRAAQIWWAVAGGSGLDIRRRSNFAQLTWIVLRSWFTDGDLFYRRRFKARPGDLLDLKIQLIEADRVSNPANVQDTPTLIEGVELDEDGAPLGFHVADRHPGDRLSFALPTWTRQPAFDPTTGEWLMRQVALLERDGQTRGVSVFAPVIESVKQLTRYSGAELDAAVVSSFIMAVLTTETGDDLEAMGTGSNQPIVGFAGGEGSASADRQIELAPAAIPNLRPGEKLEAFNPQRPNSGFEQFFRAFCSIIGVAVGLPHELLIKHFTSSYSASRGAMIEAWRGFKTKRQLIVVDQFAQPTYEAVIYESVDRGYLEAPGFFDDPIVRSAYCECQWSGPVMGQLNPQQEVAAARERIELTLSTLEEETAEISGGDDWDRKVERRAKEERVRRELGLGPTEKTAAAAVPAPPAPAGSGDPQNTVDDTVDSQDTNAETAADRADALEREEHRANLEASTVAITELAGSVRALAEREMPAPTIHVAAPAVSVTAVLPKAGAKVIRTPEGREYHIDNADDEDDRR
jgi:lambda family phage portal protein